MMNIDKQLEAWITQNTLIELHLILARNHHRKIYGRIFSFEAKDSRILFYNDDTKSIENISLNEIENVYPSSYPSN